MSDFTSSSSYRRCQALFDRWYPDFRNAGQRYHDLVTAAVTPETALLDLGCGRDSLAGEAIQEARRSVGIDLSFSNLRHNQTVTHALLADGGTLPFAAASFDVLISQWVMEHLARPQRVFSEIARVLRPNGQAILFTTNALNYVPLASRLGPEKLQSSVLERWLRRPAHESFPTHFRANTGRRLTHLGQNVGLELTACEYVGNPFYLAFSPLLFRGALLFEKITDAPMLRRFKLYLIATLRKAPC
ncbi:MAG: methyltransferase domain-containing protein [Chloroflexi bacterium]|jgi:SAM-dependent methyltransferase|nr:methyltransferase domain-containing protein [Chloroflexota bacterium]